MKGHPYKQIMDQYMSKKATCSVDGPKLPQVHKTSLVSDHSFVFVHVQALLP